MFMFGLSCIHPFCGRTNVQLVMPVNTVRTVRLQCAHLHPYYYVIRIGSPYSQYYYLCQRHSNLRTSQLNSGPAHHATLIPTTSYEGCATTTSTDAICWASPAPLKFNLTSSLFLCKVITHRYTSTGPFPRWPTLSK